MRSRILSLALIASALLGCSDRPDVSNIQSDLNEFWGQCKGIKLSDLKKTNGIDRGDSYEISYSYKLKLTQNLSDDFSPSGHATCPAVMFPILFNAGFSDSKDVAKLKKGDVINVSASATLIKSENGWVVQ